jgi:hypothetical protein
MTDFGKGKNGLQTIINCFESGHELGVRIYYSFEANLLSSADAACRLKSYSSGGSFFGFLRKSASYQEIRK